ncbi:putative Nitrogen permease regulator 3 [Glarea lozoyensis 74030]|uniref:Nitrogen permease regulator 3 n=1 Tax=Glarea lozoyensis (strain ATCC 74030 / MF5533) TaxID=1104152 RepID=H0EGF6_GLAL7|nr:putative Nitrogen permease regulator 3 [Glarea lozoyensis 74030]
MKLNPSRAHLDVKLLTSQLTNMANARDIMHPGLCAIALVIRAREGPRFVFHYPPHPDGKAVVREARFGTELDTEPISPVLEGEESDEEFGEEENIGGEVEHGTDADGTHVAPWDRLWEFPTADLESILTPSRAFHKRRFELSLDPVVFVSYPVHIREEGGWKKKRFKKSRRRKEGEREGEEAKESMGKEEEEDEGGMTMFNVVFMVNVSREEEDGRVQEVFEHVVKKFNKALNHAQASDNYVWKESEMILGMKDKAREEIAQTQNVELSSLLILAQHLIYWRRAIAIPPLHARETYIVSPNCDSRQLPIASIAWKKAFPLAPSLPSYLASLSAAPRPYKHFSPSKNHRPTYLDMLAWAMRGGWVTPLRTYAWILVHPEIIYEVDYQLKAAAVEKARNKSKTAESDQDLLSSSTDSSTHFPKDPNSMTTSQAAEHARLARLARKTAEETAIFAAEFEKLPPPVATAHPSLNTAPHLKHLSPRVAA